MITTKQLQNTVGLKGTDSILQILANLSKETGDSYSHTRGRSTLLEPSFFKTYFEKSRVKKILPFSQKIISVANNKGGVGKTGVAAMTAYKMSQLGYKTLCIDTDPQANLTTYLLGENFKADFTLYDFFKNKCSLDELVIRINDNLSIIPSGLDNDFLSEAISPIAIPKTVLSKITAVLDCNLVVIDTNPTLSDINLAFHSITDMLVTVANNDLDSIKGFKNVLAKTEMINYDGINKLVFNKIDAREKLDSTISRVQDLIGEKSFSISSHNFRTDANIKKAQENENGAIHQIDMNSKCQQDALDFTVEILRDLSSIDNQGLLQ